MNAHLTPFREAAQPFLDAGLLGLGDVLTVARIAPLLGEADADVCLALAFATRAPRLGHTGARLTELTQTPPAQQEAPLPWPDADLWLAKVQASPALDPGGHPERPFLLRGDLLLTRRYATYESSLASALVRRATAGSPGLRGAELPLAYLSGAAAALLHQDHVHPAQAASALAALHNRLTIISGGPGTGKTYTLKRVLALLYLAFTHTLQDPPHVALAAPTGKAAVRMQEAMREGLDDLLIAAAGDPALHDALAPALPWLRSLPASTLHRLLGYNPLNPTRYKHNARSPLAVDVVIVDEASMVDIAMMTHLVQAVPPSARLILVGDRQQLASVEAGSVLADLTAHATDALDEDVHRFVTSIMPGLDAHIPKLSAPRSKIDPCLVRYTKAFRFKEDSGIGQVAYAIAREDLAPALRWLTGGPGPHGTAFRDLAFHDEAERELSDAAFGHLHKAWEPHIRRFAAPVSTPAEAAHLLALLDAMRVLCAHRKGPRGVAGLTERLRGSLTSALRGAAHPATLTQAAPVGLPIMITRNDYELGLMNGDVGVIVNLNGQPTAVFPPDPNATVGPVLRQLPPARLPDWEPALAMTIHKSQGSQFAHALIVLPHEATPLLTRELLYTGLTRASSRVSLFAPKGVVEATLQRRVQRASGLTGLIGVTP